ncbi:hypothetical protein HYX16_01705 [Candidatus Woesearchaeota archaeon]|nr:hypothetical protein [Candidatus Woesearchaeota archaeon]
MAKTIMISNEIYGVLKKMKGEESFTELIKHLVKERETIKTGKELFKLLGALKDDKEYEKILKESKKGWAKWTKRYA